MAKTKTVKTKTKKVKTPAAPKPAKVTKVEKAEKIQKVEKVENLEKVAKAGLPDDKQKIIELFAQGKGDTGSPEVQVALSTHKIENLASHLGENKKDNHSRRGLLKVIAKRRRILNYLQRLDVERYKKLIERLGLKK